MPDLYPLIRPLLFRMAAEGAHDFVLRALESGLAGWVGGAPAPVPAILRQRLWGLDFANPVGLAAGFDKDARVVGAMLRLGFGFVEIGTVTPRPQRGNDKPRLFRLDEDRAVINRMGFNSAGLEAVVERLLARSRPPGILGINLGKNRDSEDAIPDYEEGVRRMAPLADFLVVNISSPNTPGLRDLQHRTNLETLLGRLLAARAQSGRQPPLLVKIAPDLDAAERAGIAEVALAGGVDGLVVGNTTLARPSDLKSAAAGEAGGLSGRPLLSPSTALLAEMYRLTGGRLPLVGVGGIASAEDAYAKIRAGASLVELYTALVFEGPALVRRITTGLARLLQRDGFARIEEAVGGAAVAPLQTSRSRAS